MFPNQITLKICKRVSTDEERNTLAQLKQEIFDKKTKPFDILKKYFKVVRSIDKVRTLNNITFYNFRSRSVGKHIHSLQKKPRKKVYVDGICYYSGMEIVCKKYNRKPKLYVNYTYEIIKVSKKEFIIQDVCDMEEFKIPIELISKHFRLAYASTCHSFQGLSVDGPITVFDTNTCRTNRKWLWTAITRSTDLSQIQIYQHSDKECYRLKESMIFQKLRMKVSSYKSQDKKAGRKWDEKEYIDDKWISRIASRYPCCPVCKCRFTADNVSVNRIDNSLPHLWNNCRLTCVDCNLSRNNQQTYPAFGKYTPQDIEFEDTFENEWVKPGYENIIAGLEL